MSPDPACGAITTGVISMMKAPYCAPADLGNAAGRIAFLGIPYDGANVAIERGGSGAGPMGLRIASSWYGSWSFDWDVDLVEAYDPVDCGDAPIAIGNAVRTHELVEDVVGTIVAAGATPVCIGGDHSITIPATRAVARSLGERRMGYIAIDAHIDGSPDVDGELESNCSNTIRVAELPNVRGENMAIVGPRGSLNHRDWIDAVRERGVNLVPMRDVRRRGVAPGMRDALDRVWDGVDGVYVTFDTDSIDAAAAPGTTGPEPGGFTPREILTVGRMIGERGFTAIDNVELCPAYDVGGGVTARLVWQVLAEMLYANARHDVRG